MRDANEHDTAAAASDRVARLTRLAADYRESARYQRRCSQERWRDFEATGKIHFRMSAEHMAAAARNGEAAAGRIEAAMQAGTWPA